jgi:pyruvate/2-oxoglutarate dehydrogenase complex dihydrolipoamide dehydrogenase (E3) component
MARNQYDMTIIGGGSGGLTAARVAAALGANVLLIDKTRLGGDCLRYGCVPSKSLIHVARVVQQAKESMSLRLVPADLEVDMAKVTAYIQGVISRVEEAEQVYSRDVTVKFGQVALKSATELLLNDEVVTSRNTLIATGSRPATSKVEGLQETGYLTNEDVFDLMSLPRSIVIVGGGPIGVELGQSLHRLGAEVTIIQGPDRILPKEDPEVSALITQVLQKEGIRIVTGARLVKASRSGQKKVITTKQSDQMIEFESDEILLALGRQPNIENMNLEATGIAYDGKGIKVDSYLQTSTQNVLAIGDVIGGYLFTHVASYQAGVAVRNALVPIAKKKVDYRVVPWCTFTDPEVARVGLTPEEAEKQYKDVRIEKLPWAEIDRAQTENETVGFIKLIMAGKKEEIVGAHMVGARAGELLGEISLAMRHNLTISDIYNTIHVYPTMNTGIQQAAFEAYLKSDTAASNRKLVSTVLRFRG